MKKIFVIYEGWTTYYESNKHKLCPVGYDFFTEYVIFGLRFRKTYKKVRF